MNTTIESEEHNGASTSAAKGQARAPRKPSPLRRQADQKKKAGEPKADRTNKKAEVITMMKRAKGATALSKKRQHYTPQFPSVEIRH